ncbi:MAG: SRPBCC domain-containing protein [Steroidobacteraceae bacterium]|nr:SRPBCC domain-containing protein [Steroidobacteraceae bacterium]
MRNDLPPAVLEQLRRERRLPYSTHWPILAGAAAGLLLRLAFNGSPGEVMSAMLASFIVGSPLVVGVVTVYLAELEERRTWTYYFVSPVIASALYVAGSLAILIEGLICAILIVPLFAIVGGLSGLAMGAICRMTNWPRPTIVSCIAVLPFIFGSFENQVPRDHRERVQEREIFVAAPPSAVWRELVDTRDIRREEVGGAWMYRIGVPVPSAGAGELLDGEHLRHITMGKGIRFDQVATEWVPDERVSWRNRFAPDSFPAGALDDHVRIGGDYFDLGETTYSLRPDGAGTRLSVVLRYRVSTHFNWYAGPVADFLVGDFAARILDFYARRALSPQPTASS